MAVDDIQQELLDKLADEFSGRIRAGQKPSIAEYARRHPELAAEIEEFLSSVAMIEGLKPAPGDTAEAAFRPLRQPLMVEQLGDYRIVREIGRGGMGIVFEAIHESLGRRVAIKVLPHSAQDGKYLNRFRREAKAAAKLHHPNIVPVFGVGESDGHHYYVMEFIEGQSLCEVLGVLRGKAPTVARELTIGVDDVSASAVGLTVPGPYVDKGNGVGKPKPIATPPPAYCRDWSELERCRWIARIGAQVAGALDYAHRHSILHRDIKPANLILDQHDSVWVTDFGLAKQTDNFTLTKTGDILGTPQYMAPESFEGEYDERSETYSLGLTLYEMLTLQPAFDATTTSHRIRQASGEPPTPLRRINPAIPRDLETVVLKAVAYAPRDRYRTASELLDDLQRFLNDRPVLARRVTMPEKLWRWARRNPAVAGLSAATLVSLAAVAIVFAVGSYRTGRALVEVGRQKDRAERHLGETTRALADARREYARAETNLRLAMQAFEQMMENIESRSGAATLGVDLGDGIIAGPETSLTPADIKLLESLLSFFDEFARENSKDLSLPAATAKRRMADIQLRLGRFEDADRSFQSALDDFSALSKRRPRELELVLEQIRILNELSVSASRRGSVADATSRYRRARALFRQSDAIMQTDEGRFEMARTLSLYGSMSSRVGIAKLLALGRPHRSPAGRTPVPVRYLKVSPRMREEVEASRQAIKLFQDLVDESPDNLKYRAALARAHRDEARLLILRRDGEAGERALSTAIDLFEKLDRDASGTPAFRFELADALGTPMPFDRKHLARLARANGIADDLLSNHPSVAEYQALKGRILSRFASAQLQMGSVAKAEQYFSEALALQELLANSRPTVSLYQVDLAHTYQGLAEVEIRRRRPKQAAEQIEKAIDRLKGFDNSERGRFLFLRPLLQKLRDRRSSLEARGAK